MANSISDVPCPCCGVTTGKYKYTYGPYNPRLTRQEAFVIADEVDKMLMEYASARARREAFWEIIQWLENEIEENQALAHTPQGYNFYHSGAVFALRRALSRANSLRDAAPQGDTGAANEPDDGTTD